MFSLQKELNDFFGFGERMNFFLNSIFIISFLANVPVWLNFQNDLSSYNNQEVQVRGFLYKTNDERLIIASTPDLKSCCIGSESKLSQQIFVKGSWDNIPNNQAVTLQGHFLVEPLKDLNGGFKQLYTLNRGKIVSEGTSLPMASFALAGIGFGSAIIALYFFRKSRIKPNG
jgi:hypothetical protein